MPKKEPLYPHIPRSQMKREPEQSSPARDIRPGDLVKSRVWKEGESYPWLTVIGGPYKTSWMGKPINEYKVTNGLTENNVFEDTIFDHIAKHHPKESASVSRAEERKAEAEYAPYSKEGWEDHLRQLERTLEQIRAGSIKVKGAYITNPNYGGYSFTEAVTRPGVALISGAVDYANPEEVLLIAETGGLKEVSLAGDWWIQAGFEGWGQKIPISLAKEKLPEWKAIFLGILPKRTIT